MSTIGKLIDRIKLIAIKREFNKIYNLVLENSNRTEKKSFADGTPYTEEELNRRITDIENRIYRLKVPVKNDDLLYAVVHRGVGFLDIGVERLIQLYNKEPEYIKYVILGEHTSSNEFIESEYFSRYNENMSIDEIIKEWFEVTATQMEQDGFHDFIDVRESKTIGAMQCDATRYGESFIKAYPEFFVEDRALPEEIKQKFYNTALTIDDYKQYAEEFEGVMFGIGIHNNNNLDKIIGIRHYTELIKDYSQAIQYFHDMAYVRNRLDSKIHLFKEIDNIEDIKKMFQEIIEDELKSRKKSVLRGNIELTFIRDNEFLRNGLSELGIDDNAPIELAESYYEAILSLEDLDKNPEWIKYLEGKDEYIKARVIEEYNYEDWREDDAADFGQEVNNYMSILYENEFREDIIDRKSINNSALTPIFRQRNPDVFYDDLPRDIRIHFQKHDWTFDDVFMLPAEQKDLLRNKQIHMAFPHGANKNFCQKYGGDFEAFEIYEKYAGLMKLVVLSKNKDFEDENLEFMIKKRALNELRNSFNMLNKVKIGYDDRVPDEYKKENSEFFLDEDAPNELKEIFYGKFSGKITFEYLRRNSEYLPFLKGKYIYHLFSFEYADFFNFCINQDEVLRLGIKYGDYVRHLFFEPGEKLEKDGEELLAARIYTCIITNAWNYSDLGDEFKNKNPELFLMDDDLQKIEHLNDDEKGMIKKLFYQKKISFSLLGKYPELIEIMEAKNSCVIHDGKIGCILDKFTEIIGNRAEAFNLIISNKYSEKLDKVAQSDAFEESLEKAICYYQEAGFIPELVIVQKLPKEKIKGFALNRKLWREIVATRDNLNADILGSLIEAALVMGVFETKKFKKNGKVMLQGKGEEGLKKLQKFLNYMPKYYREPFTVDGEAGVEYRGQGYIKEKGDFYEELIYEKLEQAAIEAELLDEFIDGFLDEYDLNGILSEMGNIGVNVKDFFEKNPNEYFSCKIDRNMGSKVNMMLKTLGIKNDEVLFEDDYALIEQCDENYIRIAFEPLLNNDFIPVIGKVLPDIKQAYEYKFNISEVDGKFIIGSDCEIDEEQSLANKRLFDYVKFLMAENGLEAEAGRLGANNDRSNINLILSQEKMNIICNAANRISQSALSKYSGKINIWEIKKSKKFDYISDNVIHQLFDGMEMEYNKKFSEFILNNIRTIVEDNELLSRINSIQKQVIEMSKDPDYVGQELTIASVLRAIRKIKYNNRKVGFEKGEELAQKFAFSQEYFEIAQEIWQEARKREASAIPRVQGQEGRYSYEVLRLDDAIGIYAGNITNCCQKLGGAGETSMLHSMKEKHGRVFVVRDKSKRIIAQSWLWRNGDTICFDNVEIPRNADNQKNQDVIYEVLKKVAKELCDKDVEVVDKLVKDGKLDKKTGELIKAKKVTVGEGNTDIKAIADNENEEIEDKECKYPIGNGEYYKGIDVETLYTSDSRQQVILYMVDDYKKEEDQPIIAIHMDENIEKNCLDLTNSELKMMREIEREIEEESEIDTVAGLVEQYEVEPEELNSVIGTDWFMLYSEKDEEITVHKMLKSPSSGIMIKSIREQREAVKMLMDKGKAISMEFENDRVHKAAKSMVKHMQKRYTMKVADEGDRISVSEIQTR